MRMISALPLVVATIAACSDNPTQPQTEAEAKRVGPPAPLYLAENRNATTSPRTYLVVVSDAVEDAIALSRQLGRLHGFEVQVAWNTGLRFFAAQMSPDVVQALRLDSRIKYIQEEQMFRLGTTYPNPPSWGLDRVDQDSLPLNQTYQDYLEGNWPLITSHSYIIDTGIRYTHQEFGGRATPGFDYDSANNPRGSASFAVDCNGHGTHVAGTVGGQTFGVSKRAQLYGVRVFSCTADSTPSSRIASGVNWVTANAIRPAVANMSLWGPPDNTIDDAVRASISSGVTYVVIAGNGNGASACAYSPARVTEAITVASTDITDRSSSFTNIGSCVDIFAPGSAILSAWIGSDTDSRIEDGTSMAAPHVTGTLSNFLAENDPNLPPSTVQQALMNNAITGRVINPGAGSPNKFLKSVFHFNVVISGPTEVPCGESRTFQILGFDGVGPYNSFAAFLNGVQVGSSDTFTIQGAQSGFMYYADLEIQARDTRGTLSANGSGIYVCQ